MESERTGKYFRINISKIHNLCDKLFENSAYILVHTPIDRVFVKYMAVCGASEFSVIDWFFYLWILRKDNFLKSEKNVKGYAGFYMSPKTIARQMRNEGLVWVTDSIIKYFFEKWRSLQMVNFTVNQLEGNILANGIRQSRNIPHINLERFMEIR